MAEKSYNVFDRSDSTIESRNFMKLLYKLKDKPAYMSGAFSLTTPEYGIDEEHAYFEAIEQEWGITPCIYGAAHFDLNTYKVNYQKGAIPTIHSRPSNANKLMDELSIECKARHYDGIVHYDSDNPNRNPKIYDRYMEELKQIADLFENFEKNGINVYMYRPFGEMNNSVHEGFFGMTEEGYRSFKNVWRQMCKYFYDIRGLKGLIMTFVPAAFAESIMFYPGDEYVDIMSPTCYSEANTGELDEYSIRGYEWMLKTGKPISLSESSVRVSYHVSAPEKGPADWLKLVESIIKIYPELTFVVSWFGHAYTMFPPKDPQNITQGNFNGYEYMNHPAVLSLDKIQPIHMEGK